MARDAVDDIVGRFDLPQSFLYDFASRKSVTVRTNQCVVKQTIGKSRLFIELQALICAGFHRTRLAKPCSKIRLHVDGNEI